MVIHAFIIVQKTRMMFHTKTIRSGFDVREKDRHRLRVISAEWRAQKNETK